MNPSKSLIKMLTGACSKCLETSLKVDTDSFINQPLHGIVQPIINLLNCTGLMSLYPAESHQTSNPINKGNEFSLALLVLSGRLLFYED